jgi:ribosomal protein S18 acetylase RimI-like enzyme
LTDDAATPRVRRGGPSDLAFIADLGRRSVEESISALRPAPLRDVERSYDRMIRYAAGQPHLTLIAQTPGERLGFVLLMNELPDEVTGQRQAFVAFMAVEPHARRRGVGRLLLDAAEAEARARGLPAIALMVTEDNDAARALYAAAGFATERRLLCKPL